MGNDAVEETRLTGEGRLSTLLEEGLKSRQLCIFLMGLLGEGGFWFVVVSDDRFGLEGC